MPIDMTEIEEAAARINDPKTDPDTSGFICDALFLAEAIPSLLVDIKSGLKEVATLKEALRDVLPSARIGLATNNNMSSERQAYIRARAAMEGKDG